MNDYKAVLVEASSLKKPYSRQVTYIKRIHFFPDLYGLKVVGIDAWEEISQHKISFLDPK